MEFFSSLSAKYSKIYNRDYFTVRIFANDLNVYANEIGSLKYVFSKLKPKKCMSIIPNLLTKIWIDIEEARKNYGWSKNGRITLGSQKRFPNFRNTSKQGNASFRVVKKVISLFENYMDVSFYKDILNNNFVPVISKETIKEETYVYDFTVPDNHLFWSNGMISHNSLLSIEMLANAFHKFKKTNDLPSNTFPKVKKLIMVYNNVEGVMDFPLEKMYGEDFVKSVEWVSSKTCEEFGRDVQRRVENLKSGECLLYVIDSLDATVSSAQKKRNEDALKADKDEDAALWYRKSKIFLWCFL